MGSEPGDVVRNPDFGLVRINDRRRRVDDAIVDVTRIGVIAIEGAAFDEVVTLARKALRLPKKSERAIRETLMEFAGAPPTCRVTDRISIKLAGGYPMLKKGKAIPQIQRLADSEWAPLEISEMRFGYVDRHNKLRLNMTATVMAGAAVGREVQQTLPSHFAVTTFAHALGWSQFSRPQHNLLVRMWFLGLLAWHERRGLQVAEFRGLPHQQKYNKALRQRREEPCLLGYRQQCATCPIGYVRCARATHRYTWIVRECQQCHNRQALFDPEDVSAKHCIACKVKKARQLWFKERQGV